MKQENLRELLEKQEWPAIYPFKFIVPLDKFKELDEALSDFEKQTKPSSKGNYISVSFKPLMLNPDKVLEVYEKVYRIEGIISL